MRIGTAKESYAADEALFPDRSDRFWIVILFAALATFPFLASGYWLFIACLIAINVTAATGLMILTGFTGQVSLGHAAFMGVGAYAAAYGAVRFLLPFWLTIPLGGFTAALVGALFGIPSLRVKGLYLALTTIAASFILHFIFFNWSDVTGGSRGMSIAPATLFGYPLASYFDIYWIAVPTAVLAAVGAANLLRTRIGRAFIAIRDRDISAEVLGISLFRYKVASFALASFYAGVAGGVWLYLFRVITPESFRLPDSIFFVAAIIAGGLSSVRGAILGAAFMTLVPELLKIVVASLEPAWPGVVQVLSPVRTVVFGALIVGFLLIEPLGLNEMWRRIYRRLELWPFKT